MPLMPPTSARRSLVALTAAVSLGVAVFFTLYSLVPVTRADTPELSSLFLGTMMAFVIGVQVFTPRLVRWLSLRLVVAGSVLLLAAGGLLTGVSEGVVMLLAGAVTAGAGFGILIVAGAQGVGLLVPSRVLGRALGVYGLVTMSASALGSPAGVQLALAFSPTVFGICAVFAGLAAACLAFGVPSSVGRAGAGAPTAGLRAERAAASAAVPARSGRLLGAVSGVPWFVLCFLLLGVLFLSHGLSSLPAIAAAHGGAAVVIFLVQSGNALGRWAGGELEPRLTVGGTVLAGAVLVAAGGVLGVLVPALVASAVSGALLGIGVGVIQTITLHTTMRRTDPGRASVMWNLAVDGGLWAGGILAGLALAYGFVTGGALVLAAAIGAAGAVLALRTRAGT